MQCFFKALFYLQQDAKLDNSVKSSILGSVIRLIVVSSKKSLETNDSMQQELCLECIRQFGLTQSPDVILPSIKLLICFLMYSNCVYGSKAALYIRDICEAQKTTPNKIYFRYKKDFCRVMMEQAAHNFLLGHGCSSSIQKVSEFSRTKQMRLIPLPSEELSTLLSLFTGGESVWLRRIQGLCVQGCSPCIALPYPHHDED